MKLVRTLAMAAAFSAPAAWGQDVVPNGHFHVDVSGWAFSGGQGTQEWSALDWQANPASGSLKVTNSWTILANQLSTSRSDCFLLAGPGPYELGAEIRIPSNQGSPGSALVMVGWYANQSCAQPSLGGALGTVVGATTPDSWVATLNTAIVIPSGAQSARVLAGVGKTFEFGTLSAHFDRIRFGPLGTTPVELQRFEVE